jgi:hypothetical protein
MRFIKKVTQRLLDMSTRARIAREDGLINTTDLLVATAATVVLAAGVGGTVLSTLDESKYGKAQPDAQALGQAIMTFYKDTGKWPAQAEHAALPDDSNVLLATGSVSDTYDLPAVANNGLDHDALNGSGVCGANSGQGFVNGTVGAGEYSATGATAALTSTNVYNLNDYLVRKPNAVDYPNWAGPYVQEITTDPWDRSWMAYLAPLYCSEPVTVTTTTGTGEEAVTTTTPVNNGAGHLGYAWLLSGGTNRTITTRALDSNLDPLGDDTGVQMGKLTVQ